MYIHCSERKVERTGNQSSHVMYRNFVRKLHTSSNMAAAAQKFKFLVFVGSTREGRLGERVSKFVVREMEKKYDVTVFDPLEMEFPLLRKPVHAYKDKTQIPPMMAKANETIKSVDGFVIISCEYNHCIPPALSNMMDHFPGSSYDKRPSAIITYSPGPFGGMRCAMQLRAMTGELGCISVSNIFGIPKANEAIDAEGNPIDSHMVSGLTRLMGQLEWMADAMRDKRLKDKTEADKASKE